MGTKKSNDRKGRRPLTQAEKDKMAVARVSAAQDKAALKRLVAKSKQVVSPKFWAKVDADRASAIAAVIKSVTVEAQKAKLAEIEAQAARLRESLGESAPVAQ